jgi:transcription initiation factor TFIIB
MSEATKRHEINMMRNVIAEQKSAGKNLMGLAASVLYLSCLKYEQNEISQVIIKFISLTYVMIYRRLLVDFLGLENCSGYG